MSQILRGAFLTEGQNLLDIFRNTLSFTVSLNAVNSLVAERDESALLFAVGVGAVLFIILASERLVSKIDAGDDSSPIMAMKSLVLFLLRQLGVLVVQFESNLLAHVLKTIFITAISAGWVIAFAIVGLGLFHTGSVALSKKTV